MRMNELERLARELGGAWRMEHEVMPIVVLTIDEARKLAGKIDDLEREILSLELHGPHDES